MPGRFPNIAIVLFCALMLSGCTAALSTANSRDGAVNLTSESYAAADMLIQQSRSFIDQDTVLEISPLTDLDHPNEITNLGHIISNQIASRFVQLGYNVVLSPMTHMAGPSMAALPTMAEPAGTQTMSKTMITGRYARGRDDVIINLRLVEDGTGRVLASYDYTIDHNRDVKTLAKSKAEKESKFGF